MKPLLNQLLALLILIGGSLTASAQLTYTWTGASGADLLWNTPGNWDLNNGNSPGINDTALFSDTGVVGSPGANTSNNVISVNRTIALLKETNDVSFHNTLILPGVSLTVSNIVTNALVIIGGPINLATTNTVSGPGAAVILNDTNGSVIIRNAGGGNNGQNSTWDASALDTFNANVARLLVGGDGAGTATNSRVVGTFYMAKTNVITASVSTTATPSVNVGANNSNGVGANNDPALQTSFLFLGMTNAFFADSFGVGREKCAGFMGFNPAFTNGATPIAVIRGKNAPRVATFSVGDESPLGSSNQRGAGTVDFSGGFVDAMIDTAYVGRSMNGNNTSTGASGTGTLTLSAGTLDVNTLELGFQTSGTGTGIGAVGTVNVNGSGSLLVNSVMELSHNNAATTPAQGTLNISGGNVSANRISAGGGTSTINLGAGTLAVGSTVGTPVAALTAFNITNSTLTLSPGFFTTNIVVTALNVSGTVNHINITNVPAIIAYPTNFHLLQYSVPSGDLTTFVLGTVPTGGNRAFVGYITNDTSLGSFIDLVFTTGPTNPPPPTQESITWKGAPNGNWDTNTLNWVTGGVSTNYHNVTTVGPGDLGTFDDTLTGTANVNVTTNLSPGSITVNNSLSNYLFSGTGKISGFTGISKQGTATLTLAESGGDSFAGDVAVHGGTVVLDQSGTLTGNATIDSGATLQVGANDAKGSLPTGVLTDNGTLIFSRSDAGLTLATAITGTGGLIVNGSGTVTFTVVEPFTGTTVVANGTLAVAGPNGNPSTLSANSSITINSNGVIQVNGDNALTGSTGTTPITVNAGGTLTGTAGRSSHIRGLFTLNGGNLAMQGAQPQGNQTANGSWDIEGGIVVGNPPSPITSVISSFFVVPHQTGGTLIYVTNGNTASGVDLNVTGTFVSGTSGNFQSTGITLDGGGTMAFANTNSYGGATTINGGVLRLNNSNAVQNSTVTLNIDNCLQFGTDIGTFVMGGLAGPSSLALVDIGNHPVTVQIGQNNLTTGFSGVLTGGGGLAKIGAGTLSLSGTNLYTGATTISNGVLQLIEPAALGTTPSISLLTSTATLDPSGRADGTVTLGTNQTLSGIGTVSGVLTNFGTVSPGLGLATGELTVNGNVVLNGKTAMKIDKAGGTNDLFLTFGTMTYGGTLAITSLNTTLAVGDAFQLFSASGGFSGAFSAIIPSAPGSGMSWDTNSLAVDGTLKVAVGPITGPSTNANITSVSLVGTNLIVHGTNNNVPNTSFQYVVLTTTNIATPLSNWTRVVTNPFNSGGTFDYTNPIVPGTPRQFIDVQAVP